MSKPSSPYTVANEQGFVLVTALIIMVLLTIIGIAATNTSVTEIQIAGNDKLQKQTFTQADGGTQMGSNLLEENISCPKGFVSAVPLQIGGAQVRVQNFWALETEPALPYPADDDGTPLRHIRIPNNDAVPHTNLFFFGNSSLSTGNAIQMISGYEGTGYSAATGGGQLVTNINSQHTGVNNSVSSIRTMWRHIIGHEGACLY
ncbi:MAG: pilus assembly PilX N-terminal domain-containing protein [Desulfobulbaceae bacterium]|nr:pilus assembly PilX N-terminal domain-containing protein [Desulfobulbaceae bacterium]